MKEPKERGREKRISFFLVMVLLGGIGGGVLSEILSFSLKEGTLANLLTRGWELYLKPVEINLAVINLTFGIGVKFTLISLIFMFLAGWLYFRAR